MGLKPNLTFRKLEMVEAVARLGSLRAAADRLNLSQPALTQGLKSIEHELGVTLFVRSPRGLEPTVYVEPIINHTVGIREELAAVKRDLQIKEAGQSTPLLFQCGPRSRHLWVDAAIAAMRSAGEKIQVTLVEDTPSLYDNLVFDRIDLALAPADVIPKRSDLILKPFASIKNELVCRADHPLVRCSRITLADIFRYPLVGDVISPRYLALFEPGLGSFVKENPIDKKLEPAILVTTFDALQDTVLTSDALAVLPSDLIDQGIYRGKIVQVPHVPFDLPALPVALACHKNRADNPATQRFIQYLRDMEFDRTHFFT